MNELDLFTAAVAIADPAERKALLDRECAGRPELRQRLGQLLEAHGQSNRILDASNGRGPNLTAAYDSPSPLVGTIIAGRYKLLEEIGDGGMGTVWMAEQKEPVKRLVAVKLIKAGMDSKAVLARFEAERQALAMMDHPNIAKVHDAGTDDAGRPYFVMELVKGLPLTEYCDARKLSVNDRLDLFIQICSAVQHAHQKAVIHRDLKPTNVLVTEHDGKPVPKVIDFGLAKALHGANTLTDRTLHTAYGTVVGTPLYMAPEQVGINALDVDTRTDIYALGVILYELLTGTTPLEKARFKETAWEEMKRLIREEEPPKPSTRLSSSASLPSLAASRQVDPLQLRRLIRGELDWIVMKALDKDRSRRYETANGLSRDVQRYLKGDAVEACPPTLGYRLRKLYRRNRGAALTAGAVAAALIVGLIATTYGFYRADVHRQRAEEAEQSAVENSRKAMDSAAEAIAARDALVKAEHQRIGLEYSRSIQVADAAVQSNKYGVARRVLDEARAELRGWEWHYLNRLWRSDYRVDFRPGQWPRSVSYSPDGRTLVTANASSGSTKWNGTVQFWNAETGQLVRTMEQALPQLWHAQFIGDGRRFMTRQDGAVTVWDTDTLAPRTVIKHEGESMVFGNAAIDPGGKRIVTSVTRDLREPIPNQAVPSSVAVWDAATGKPIWPEKKTWNDGRGVRVSISSDGKWILADMRVRNQPQEGSLPNELWSSIVSIWDAETGKELLDLPFKNEVFIRSVLSPTGDRIASTHSGGIVKIWPLTKNGDRPVRTGDPIAVGGSGQSLNRLVFSPDGKQFAVALRDGSVRIHDAYSGASLRTLKGHSDFLTSIDYSPDGTRIATASNDGTVKVWDARARDVPPAFTHQSMYSAALSPREDMILTSTETDTKVWDARTGKELATLKGGTGKSGSKTQTISPDGRWFATIDGSTIRIYDANTRVQRHELKGPSETYILSFSPDGKQLLAANDHWTVTVWDAVNGVEVGRIGEKSDQVGYLNAGFSPDGSTFYVERLTKNSRTLGGITIYDAKTRKPIRDLETGEFEYSTWYSALSPDGTRLVGCFTFPDASRNECSVWDTTTGRQLLSFNPNTDRVNCVAFSPDGRRIVTGCSDGSTKLWNAETGYELLTIPSEFWVQSASFNASGTRLFFVSGGVIRILDGTPLPEPKK